MEDFYFQVTLIVFVIVGLAVGSFLNVVIYRLPKGICLASPASHCTSCGQKIAWYDLFPVVSYLVLRGRCRNCGEHIAIQYPAVELLNGVLWGIASYVFYNRGIAYTAIYGTAISVLLVIAFCDAENMFIPDCLQIFLLLCAVLIFAANLSDWNENVIGALCGGGIFLFFYFLSFLLFRREGLGLGDVKLMAVSGFLLGWKGIVTSILVAILCSLFGVVIQKCKHRTPLLSQGDEFAFAPYLVIGIIFAIFFGDAMFDGYVAFVCGGRIF